MSNVITGNQIAVFQLKTIRRGIKLEIDTGMTLSRGRSCTAIAKQMLGLAKNLSKRKTLDAFDVYMKEQGIEV